jgi:hypothetical protein
MEQLKCIYENVNNKKENCKNCNSKLCEKKLRDKGICYTTNGFIQFVRKYMK